MSYQNQGSYQHVPGSELNQTAGSVAADDSMSNPNVSGSEGHQQGQHQPQGQGQSQGQYQQQYANAQQQPYHLPSYNEYMQNNVYNSPPSNFGDYGPNVGSNDWSQYTSQAKKNRRMVAFIAALFILFVIAHPAGPRAGHSSTADTGAGTGTGTGTGSTNNNAASSPVASNEGHNGVAGDGNHNNNNAKNVPPNTPSTPVSSNDETNNQKEHEHSDTDKDTHTHTGSDAISETKPKLAYLLTYPMSGTTYTMILVGKTTNTTLVLVPVTMKNAAKCDT
jgi:hypothetical protein